MLAQIQAIADHNHTPIESDTEAIELAAIKYKAETLRLVPIMVWGRLNSQSAANLLLPIDLRGFDLVHLHL